MRYKRYRGFIPTNAMEEIEIRNNKGEKRGLILLFLICLFLLPITFDKLFNDEEKEEVVQIEKNVVDFKEKILKDLKFGDTSTSFKGNERTLTLQVENSKIIKDIEKKEGINITTIKNNGNNKFSIEIGR